MILDSGADTSALPLSFAGVGDKCQDPSTTFVDAQGVPLSVESTRIATVQFGDVCFKEKFIIADVTTHFVLEAISHVSARSLQRMQCTPFELCSLALFSEPL